MAEFYASNLIELELNLMDAGFCSFPQTRLWQDLRDHLLKLPGLQVVDCADDAVAGSWIDFDFCERLFTVNVMEGEYVFFVDNTPIPCPESVLAQIKEHCARFFGSDENVIQHRV